MNTRGMITVVVAYQYAHSVRAMKKAKHEQLRLWSIFNGRGGGIRTRDPLHPMQVRYQAALRPEQLQVYQLYPEPPIETLKLATLGSPGLQHCFSKHH